MSKLRFIFGLILLKGFLPRETYSQCSGTKLVINPGNGTIESPIILGQAANCTWEFSSGGKEYMLVLTVVYLRLYFLVNGKRKCSGSYILKMNKDAVDCDRYVQSPNRPTFCNAYYSSDTCNTKQQGCEINKQTSFPVQVTYESDGRILANHSGRVHGFKIEYEYIECPPETSTPTSTTKPANTNQQDTATVKECQPPFSETETSKKISQLTAATAIMSVLALTFLIIIAVQYRQRIRAKANTTTSVTTERVQNLNTTKNIRVNEVVTDEPGYVVPIPMQQIQNTRSTTATTSASPRAAAHSRDMTTPTDEEGYVISMQRSPDKRSKTTTTPETDLRSEFATDEAGYIVRLDQNMNTRSTAATASISLTKTKLGTQEKACKNKKAVLCSKESHTYEYINSTLVLTDEVQYEAPIQRRLFNDESGTGNPVYHEPTP